MANDGENALLGPTSCPPAQGNDTRMVVPCVEQTWPVTLALSPNAWQPPPDITVPTDPDSLVCMQAVPDNPVTFQFRVQPGTFRRVHLEWPLHPYCPNLKVVRVYQCSEDCCATVERRYEMCGCPLFLPPGDYEFTLEPTDVCAALSSEGAHYDVTLWLEYVTPDYLLAFQASGSGNCAGGCK